MTAPALARLALVALLALQCVSPLGSVGPFQAVEAQSPSGSRAVVLLHHPFDHVDPFGVPYPDDQAGTDTFSARRQSAALNGRFDFPTFVADGVLPVAALPDPDVPYASTLGNYTQRIEARLATGSPGTLRLRASGDLPAIRDAGDGQEDAQAEATGNQQDGGAIDPQVDGEADAQVNGRGDAQRDGIGDPPGARAGLAVQVSFAPAAPLADPQHPDSLHLMLAVAEDFIHHLPDARISNGVADHRFTVRRLVDLGPLDLAAGQTATRNHTIGVPQGWVRENLVVAAWVEAQAPFGRFAAGEVLQSAWAKADGVPVVQASKSVLVEVYSATWCTPCLVGDLVAERIAIDYGGAPSLAVAAGPRYLEWPAQPVLAGAAALAAGALMALWRPRRGR